jgi:hypothetical protein
MENVDYNIDRDMQLQKIKKELFEKLNEYKNSVKYLAADAPIEILCLPKVIEKSLLDYGCIRVYDLFDCDFTKIKGLGEVRIRHLTSCINQFLSML